MRDARGRFVKGNNANPSGRPKQKVDYLGLLQSALTPDRWLKIVGKATEQAERGNKDARKWLSDYAIGQPVATQRNVTYTPEQYAAALAVGWESTSGNGSDTNPAESRP